MVAELPQGTFGDRSAQLIEQVLGVPDEAVGQIGDEFQATTEIFQIAQGLAVEDFCVPVRNREPSGGTLSAEGTSATAWGPPSWCTTLPSDSSRVLARTGLVMKAAAPASVHSARASGVTSADSMTTGIRCSWWCVKR